MLAVSYTHLTGGIAYGIEVFDDAQDTDAFRAMFAVRGKALRCV